MSLTCLFLALIIARILFKMRTKILYAISFVVVVLLINLLYAIAQDDAFTEDGQFNFDNPDAVAQAIASGGASVEDLFSQGSIEQIESVFNRAIRMIQSEILSFYTGPATDVTVNGEISSFSNGVITTDSTSLNLNDFKNFDGAITINEDGSITIAPNIDTQINIDDAEISGQNSIKITGTEGERRITAITGPVAIQTPQDQVVLNQGSVVLTSEGAILQENSEANFAKTRIETLDSKVNLGFTSEENSYVLFDQQNRKGLLAGRDFIVEFFKDSPYEFVDVDGNSIGVINGGLIFIFDNDRIMEDVEIGRGVKNMILKNLKTNHKVGIAKDGGYVGYNNQQYSRVGSYNQDYFFLEYDAILLAKIDEVITDFEILYGKLPPNPNENPDFQDFVVQQAEIQLRIKARTTNNINEEDLNSAIDSMIKRSRLPYIESDGTLSLKDSELQNQKEQYFKFMSQFSKSVKGSEVEYMVKGGKGIINVYPNSQDRSTKVSHQFPNDRFLREVFLPDWITYRNNVEKMPPELLRGFNK